MKGKIFKKVFFATLIFFVCLFLCSCSVCGYNEVMYKHLSNADNYKEYTVKIKEIVYSIKGETKSDFNSDDVVNADRVSFLVEFTDENNTTPFYDKNEGELLEVIIYNNISLYESGFYKALQLNTEVTLKSSHWIYMDGKFFYVCQVTYNKITYLSQDLGIQNIIKHMDENRGL